jgi:hypothetical protein
VKMLLLKAEIARHQQISCRCRGEWRETSFSTPWHARPKAAYENKTVTLFTLKSQDGLELGLRIITIKHHWQLVKKELFWLSSQILWKIWTKNKVAKWRLYYQREPFFYCSKETLFTIYLKL